MQHFKSVIIQQGFCGAQKAWGGSVASQFTTTILPYHSPLPCSPTRLSSHLPLLPRSLRITASHTPKHWIPCLCEGVSVDF